MCSRKENLTITNKDKMILYQIANAAVQFSETEMNNALSQVNCSAEDRSKLSSTLNAYRLNGSNLMVKKRHPVLLILDEVVHIIS